VLTADMQRVVEEQRLGFAATVCPDGTPNLSPKGTTRVWDGEHLMFADVCSPGTVRNLRANPAIEVNVVDPFVRKGYRFKGTATLHTDGPVFEEALRRLNRTRETVDTVVLIAVERAAPLVSPSYDEGMTEADVVARWRDHYAALLGR
jgi:predicted pyridoxine 5'-phosphate oxidase superfamily flavin-nucleotide-binding protein